MSINTKKNININPLASNRRDKINLIMSEDQFLNAFPSGCLDEKSDSEINNQAKSKINESYISLNNLKSELSILLSTGITEDKDSIIRKINATEIISQNIIQCIHEIEENTYKKIISHQVKKNIIDTLKNMKYLLNDLKNQEISEEISNFIEIIESLQTKIEIPDKIEIHKNINNSEKKNETKKRSYFAVSQSNDETKEDIVNNTKSQPTIKKTNTNNYATEDDLLLLQISSPVSINNKKTERLELEIITLLSNEVLNKKNNSSSSSSSSQLITQPNVQEQQQSQRNLLTNNMEPEDSLLRILFENPKIKEFCDTLIILINNKNKGKVKILVKRKETLLKNIFDWQSLQYIGEFFNLYKINFVRNQNTKILNIDSKKALFFYILHKIIDVNSINLAKKIIENGSKSSISFKQSIEELLS